MRSYAVLTFLVLLAGCQSVAQKTFVANGPQTYPPVEKVTLVNVGTQDPNKVYEAQYKKAVVVGVSEYDAPEEEDFLIKRFARQMGADVVLVNRRYSTTVHSTEYTPMQVQSQLYFSEKSQFGRIKGWDETTQTVYVPHEVKEDWYAYAVMFLRTPGAGPGK